ncbi:conserved hypothetical protein [Coccidioides posadasii str. Silveira]|uniref:Uncharacterized protein n=1 Tax=Coccidioides posadasii (strain RMSCC 757 / Silveira) TaxID=443226 RepID=E9D461_COCPS|nr:conserved hypothetical protein [Coccidioides posadasii str. Silveira]
MAIWFCLHGIVILSPPSPLVVAAPSTPAQAGSAALSFSLTVVALALARNIVVVVVSSVPAGFANLVVLPGLSSYTGAQALSVCKRAWCCKSIQRPVLIAGLDNLNQLTIHTQLCKSILITRAEAQLPPEQKCSACKRVQQSYSNIVFAECISVSLGQKCNNCLYYRHLACSFQQ